MLLTPLCLPGISPATISLPLQGYYRPGRYMPVQIDPTTTDFETKGALPTLIESKTDSIVPLLIYGFPKELTPALPLRPVPDVERLVAFDSDAQTIAQSLFPQEKIISIPVNSSDPLPGPPAAWESLDAVVLSSTTIQRLDDSHRSALLAAGVILASVGEIPPDSRWPWKRQGHLWLLRYEPAGPEGQLINESVYSPTYTWAPALPAPVRAQIMIAGILLGILVIALAMWKAKSSVVGIILLAIVATAGVICWRHNFEIVNRAGGDVLVVSPDLMQRDSWLYERARDAGVRRIEWDGSTHPILASIAQTSQMRIVVSSTGSLAFEYQTTPGETISFIRRDVRPTLTLTATPSHSSPLQDLAKNLYISKGSRIAGEQAAGEGRWNTVIVDQSMPTSNQ